MKTARIILRDSVRQTDKLYTYLIPEDMYVDAGFYVEVPFGFGSRTQVAVVYDVSDKVPDDIPANKLKAISRVIDTKPVMTAEQLDLIAPICNRYLCTRGDAVSLMVPSIVGKVARDSAYFVSIKSKEDAIRDIGEGKFRSVNHINILEFLISNGECEKKKILSITSSTDAQLRALKNKGYIEVTKRLIEDRDDEVLTPDNGDSSDSHFRAVHTLNDEQDAAYNAITKSIYESDKPDVFLLHGITGSGKTEVYLKCAGEVISRGDSVIYLVPEISLTPQTVSWITGRFGNNAAVLHSRLTDKQRFLEWDRIRKGEAKIVVGPRSCIFAPAKNVKLIIIDEEHDSSYKSESFPKYSTRDIATLRARYNNAALVLGSATPSVTTFYAAQKGYYKLLTLSKRANPDAVLPKVRLIDMKDQAKEGAGDLLSMPLRQAIAGALADNKQILLFLNRRGYSRTLVCNDCGEPCSCPNCSVGMTLHNNSRSNERLLICHYCGYTIPASQALCGCCGGKKFKRAGMGTQQLEELLGKLYPNEKVLRMDQDTTMAPGAHEEIISKFRNREASILIGTQMIAKGHDFPDVTVVGILGADLIAASSDYRSSERAFQLITQAAGRAGRGEAAGTVYIQSNRPNNPLIGYAACQDYVSFYDAEIEYRRAMGLPPFNAMGEIVLSLPDEDMLASRSNILEKYLNDFLNNQDSKYGFELYGPVQAPIYELRGRYRMQFIIKAVNKSAMNAIFEQVMKDFDPEYYPISFDTDATSG